MPKWGGTLIDIDDVEGSKWQSYSKFKIKNQNVGIRQTVTDLTGMKGALGEFKEKTTAMPTL